MEKPKRQVKKFEVKLSGEESPCIHCFLPEGSDTEINHKRVGIQTLEARGLEDSVDQLMEKLVAAEPALEEPVQDLEFQWKKLIH